MNAQYYQTTFPNYSNDRQSSRMTSFSPPRTRPAIIPSTLSNVDSLILSASWLPASKETGGASVLRLQGNEFCRQVKGRMQPQIRTGALAHIFISTVYDSKQRTHPPSLDF